MENKICIVYFKRKGHDSSASERIASQIADALNGKSPVAEEYAVTPVEEYPVDNKAEFEGIVELEKKNRIRPELTDKLGKFRDYKTFVLVGPNWFGDYPMAMYSFLDEYDFGHKRIVPVVCHAGDGGEEIRKSIRNYMPMCDVYNGVDIANADSDADAIAEVVKEALDTPEHTPGRTMPTP